MGVVKSTWFKVTVDIQECLPETSLAKKTLAKYIALKSL